ncbi:hypothetical protein P170DRAFT_479363 [Aspergillus steynii IBT 23096]|uniref:Uncharacterized protein n=1 Tax=Aspergillus steynii IBT 23096 TaxID=1392250 RepID=A0A2I2FW16_9EURO|nr:uncharacterized protein P170DRAFT_479363 [Aspergillus steynii IBT 23096]PLB44815.1 hypothetical protein P170DRAFT_479363 [Aspergillus steynii IBT 23096]
MLRPRFPSGGKISRVYRTDPKKLPKALLLFTLRLVYWSAIHLGCPVIAIISVECIISANGLPTEPIAHSTGQMLVLAMGIANLAALLWEIASDYWIQVQRSSSHLQDTLSMHTYYSSKPPDEEQLESILAELLYSSRHWGLVPGMFITHMRKQSLASLLQTALVRELVKKLNATVEKDKAPAPIERYFEIRAAEKLRSSHSDNGDYKEVALCQAAAHGDLSALQILLFDYGGNEKGGKFRVCDEKEEIVLPVPQSADGIMKLCDLARLFECAADEGSQWETSRLLNKYCEYLREQATQMDGTSDTSSTVTLSESVVKESSVHAPRSTV